MQTLNSILSIIAMATLFAYFSALWWGKCGGKRWQWFYAGVLLVICSIWDIPELRSPDASTLIKAFDVVFLVFWSWVFVDLTKNRFWNKQSDPEKDTQ